MASDFKNPAPAETPEEAIAQWGWGFVRSSKDVVHFALPGPTSKEAYKRCEPKGVHHMDQQTEVYPTVCRAGKLMKNSKFCIWYAWPETKEEDVDIESSDGKERLCKRCLAACMKRKWFQHWPRGFSTVSEHIWSGDVQSPSSQPSI